ncbi:MAG: hypothetical protein LUD39_03195 [Opitutae bacterium]|nr:hypothetical protein [Opitutae bacterium]
MRDVSPEQIRVTTIVARCRHHRPESRHRLAATNPFSFLTTNPPATNPCAASALRLCGNANFLAQPCL